MEKTVAYVAMAILLGVVAMLPVMLLTPKRVNQGYLTIPSAAYRPELADVEDLLREMYGLAEVPLSPLNLGLTIALSFVFASGVSFYFKRKRFQLSS